MALFGCAAGKGHSTGSAGAISGPDGSTTGSGDSSMGPGSGGGSVGDADGGEDSSSPGAMASGGSCTVNSDCVNSPAAQALANVRCAGFETYCVTGTCYADCAPTCTAVRTDVNPCPSPRFCQPSLGVCKIVPIRCNSRGDCPVYLPPLTDGGTAAWSCDAGTCAYPGTDYATH